jgi:2'-5' RNA ligase
MKTNGITKLANQIIALRSTSSPIPQPLTYKSGGNTGAMIALFLPDDEANAYALRNMDVALPLDELHLTLVYLGKAADMSPRQIMDTHDLMRLISENHSSLTGHINGCGRFCNGDDDGDPFFIIPDLPALPNLRQAIIDGLKSRAVDGTKNHGFVPHITLTYLPHAEYNPFDILEKTPISFGAISLVLGDDRYDYPLAQGVPLLSKAALIEKIGARHTRDEGALIQKIHDLTLDLGGECHPLTRRAGARHSRGDQVMVQRIHDDCSGLGAVCRAMPEKDRVYSSQVLKENPITKAQSDAPNYQPASTPQRCANCRFFLGDPGRDWCTLFDFTADPDYVSDAWEPQRPDEIPGYVANKGDLAALTEGILMLRGSAGSGNFGHTGRKGKLGGSGRGGGLRRIGAKGKSSPAARKKAAKKFREKQAKKQVAKQATGKKPSATKLRCLWS